MPASITITSLHPHIFTDIWDNLGPSIASMIIHGFFSGTHNLDLLKGHQKIKNHLKQTQDNDGTFIPMLQMVSSLRVAPHQSPRLDRCLLCLIQELVDLAASAKT